VIDTESNLKPPVIRKNLYYLGFPSNKFEAFEGRINKLLEYRNPIAHGESSKGIDRDAYESLREAAYEVMNAVKRDIMQAIEREDYLREDIIAEATA
jgi:hypothetical protein